MWECGAFADGHPRRLPTDNPERVDGPELWPGSAHADHES